MSEIKALTYSEMDLYLLDKKEHYDRYVLGITKPEGKSKKIGSFIHKYIEKPEPESLVAGLNEIGLGGKERDLIKSLCLKAAKLPKPKQREIKMLGRLPGGKDMLYVRLDGFDPELRFVTEYKTGDTDMRWDQSTVDFNPQLTFTALVYYLNTKQFLRNMVIYAMSTKNAGITAYQTVRGPMDLKLMADRVGDIIDQMKAKGLWEKRKSAIHKIATPAEEIKQL